MDVGCHCSEWQAPDETVVLCGHDGLLHHVLEQYPLQHAGRLGMEMHTTDIGALHRQMD